MSHVSNASAKASDDFFRDVNRLTVTAVVYWSGILAIAVGLIVGWLDGGPDNPVYALRVTAWTCVLGRGSPSPCCFAFRPVGFGSPPASGYCTACLASECSAGCSGIPDTIAASSTRCGDFPLTGPAYHCAHWLRKAAPAPTEPPLPFTSCWPASPRSPGTAGRTVDSGAGRGASFLPGAAATRHAASTPASAGPTCRETFSVSDSIKLRHYPKGLPRRSAERVGGFQEFSEPWRPSPRVRAPGAQYGVRRPPQCAAGAKITTSARVVAVVTIVRAESDVGLPNGPVVVGQRQPSGDVHGVLADAGVFLAGAAEAQRHTVPGCDRGRRARTAAASRASTS